MRSFLACGLALALALPAAADERAKKDTGDGQIVFDTRKGLPRQITFKATILVRSADKTTRTPVSVTYELEDLGGDRFRITIEGSSDHDHRNG